MTGRWLLAFGLAYGTLHHQGFVLGRLGSVAGTGTRWADWIDLATPYLVLAPVMAALATVRPAVGARTWMAFAVGAGAYVQGHGIHLAANSVSNLLTEEAVANAAIIDVAHLWDELVGHYVWYGGLSVVVASAMAAVGRHRVAVGSGSIVWGFVVAIVAGMTYATNALEGHFAWPGLVYVGVMSAALLRQLSVDRAGGRDGSRPTVALVALPGFVTAGLMMGGYGVWHRGFPDPSSVGWNLLAR